MHVPARSRSGATSAAGSGKVPEQRSASESTTTATAVPGTMGLVGTTRAAGWSGIVFAGLLVAGLLLVNRIPKLGDSDAVYRAFYSGGSVDALTVLGLYIVPFAGIACLWHMI